MMPYLAQPCYPLNNQVLAIFFLSATTLAAPHYSAFTDRYSPQNGRLSFSLQFMIHTPFLLFTFLLPIAHLFLILRLPQTHTHHWLHWQFSVSPPPPSLSHSLDLGCVGARWMMFLGKFLVQLTHLLSGQSRLASMWLILDLPRNRCLDSQNQGTINNSLW